MSMYRERYVNTCVLIADFRRVLPIGEASQRPRFVRSEGDVFEGIVEPGFAERSSGADPAVARAAGSSLSPDIGFTLVVVCVPG